MPKAKSPPPTPGHKCKGRQQLTIVTCECGWKSQAEKSPKRAYASWRQHVGESKEYQQEPQCELCSLGVCPDHEGGAE